MMAKQYAIMHLITYKEFTPNWQNDLNAASLVRDARMAEYGTHLLVFFQSTTKESGNLPVEAEKNHLKMKSSISLRNPERLGRRY